MSPIAFLQTAVLVSVLLPAASPRHFDCEAVCAEKRRHAPNRPSGHSDSTKEPFGDIRCYGALCLVVTKHYQRMEVPQPWTAPVMGTGRGNDNNQSDTNCKEGATHTVMEVDTEFDIKEVLNINPKQGTLDMLATVSMTWSDPNIGVCLCGDHPELESYRLGSNFEDVMWVPDLTVFNSRNFRRVSGLVKLGLIKVSTVSNHCAARVTQTFDFQVTLNCAMTEHRYPVDQNICLVRLGSYTHVSDTLAFISGRPKHKHSFELSSFKDYELVSRPMCEPLKNVARMGYRKEAATFRVTGVNLIIGRKSPMVVMEYAVVMSALVAACIGSLVLSQDTSRLNMVASMVLCAIFVIITANTSTPHAQGGHNLVIWYCIISLAFIFVTFAWEAIGYENNGDNWLHHHDAGFALVLLLVYSGFNLFWWLYISAHRGWDETCDNNKYLQEPVRLVSCKH